MPSVGRSRAAARSGWRRRSLPTCARSAARSRPGATVGSLDELPTGRGPGAARRDSPAAARARRGAPARPLPPARSSATATGRASSSSTGRSTGRSRGRRPRPRGRGRSTSAARSSEIAAAEQTVTDGEHPERPFVLLVQPSLFDSTGAPTGRHTAWAYCHVPNGSDARHDRGDRGSGRALRARLPRPDRGPLGDGQRGGRAAQPQLRGRRHQRRPAGASASSSRARSRARSRTRRRCPASTCAPSSTPPGGGVHGMCGYWAARAALRRSYSRTP